MSNPYIGEIRLFAGTFAPNGWLFCAGQVLPISEYDTLFNLIGTTYGGDGQETFALPNLASRVPLHMGTSGGLTYQIGETGGVESVALDATHLPVHSHALNASTASASAAFNASTGLPGNTGGSNLYALMGSNGNMAANALGSSQGGTNAHENMAPYLGIHFIISMYGIYPSLT